MRQYDIITGGWGHFFLIFQLVPARPSRKGKLEENIDILKVKRVRWCNATGLQRQQNDIRLYICMEVCV